MPGPDAQDVLAAMQGRWTDFYGQFTALKRQGGELRGACPVHGGDNPQAFSVRPEDGFWICHTRGCGKPGGDAFAFLMGKDGLTFPEAVALVAAYAGLPSTSPPGAPRIRLPRPASVKPAAPSKLLDPCLAERLHERLMRCAPMVGWLHENRGLTPETLERFRLGLDRDERDAGFYRVTFPVFDRQGQLTNIRRHLFAYKPALTDERRKALDKTKPWETGLRADLYPLSALEGAQEVLIVEGEADAVLACQMGFAAVTDTGGAATWKQEWTDELSGLDRVTLLYDGDAAGQKGARRAAASVAAVVPDIRIARRAAMLPATPKPRRESRNEADSD